MSTSWKDYVDSYLIQSGLTGAVILGHDGHVWASTGLKITENYASKGLVEMFADPWRSGGEIRCFHNVGTHWVRSSLPPPRRQLALLPLAAPFHVLVSVLFFFSAVRLPKPTRDLYTRELLVARLCV